MQLAGISEVIIICKLVTFSGKPFKFILVRAVVMAAFDYEMSVAVYYSEIVQMLHNA